MWAATIPTCWVNQIEVIMFYDYNNKPVNRPSSNEKFITEEEKLELQAMVARRIKITKEHQTNLHEKYQAQEVYKK